jgi:Na+-driven multidrug efflux pump
MSTMMEQSMGKTTSATFLSVARQGLFFIPFVLILSATLGITGIQMTQTCADILTFICAVPIHTRIMKQMGQKKL